MLVGISYDLVLYHRMAARTSICYTFFMDEQAIQEYVTGFGRRFLYTDVLEKFPETKIIPAFLQEHFSRAETVLDLGFGTGIWFWASFLSSLKRIDGFDIYQQALEEADKVLNLSEVPEGFVAAHEYIGEKYTTEDFKKLKIARGNLLIQDYLAPWPESIANTQYDLVTEYGGIGEVETNQQFKDIIKKSTQVLKPGGSMMFINFLEREVGELEKKLGRHTPDGLHLGIELFEEAVQEAGIKMIEFHAIDNPEGMPIMQTFFYGFATK